MKTYGLFKFNFLYILFGPQCSFYLLYFNLCHGISFSLISPIQSVPSTLAPQVPVTPEPQLPPSLQDLTPSKKIHVGAKRWKKRDSNKKERKITYILFGHKKTRFSSFFAAEDTKKRDRNALAKRKKRKKNKEKN